MDLATALGIEKALAARFYRELSKAVKSGRIRIALVSDECPNGYVAYDFPRESWVCVEKDGTSYPLGERPAPELLEFESEGGGG